MGIGKKLWEEYKYEDEEFLEGLEKEEQDITTDWHQEEYEEEQRRYGLQDDEWYPDNDSHKLK